MLMIEKLSDYCVHMFKSDHIFKKNNVYVKYILEQIVFI